MDVTKLTDEDLKCMLSERGFVPGPILESTRRVYQKKLQRMLETDMHAEGIFASASFEEQEYSSVDEDEDDMATADTQPIDELVARQSQNRSSPRRRQQEQAYSWQEETSRNTVTSTMEGDYSQLTRRSLRTTSDIDPSNFVTQVEPPPQQQKKGGLCAKLVIFVVFALLVFLVIQNMEPAAKDPLAGIGTD